MSPKSPSVIIIGAGIVGSSLAYHLTRENARVILIDKAPSPAHGVTATSFAWIVGAHDTADTYLNFRQQAIADWHRVEDELKGQLKVNWSGALTWYQNTIETERIVLKLINTGYPARLVDEKEILLLEPNLKNIPAQAMFAKNEGAIDPILTTELFVKAAREAGADIQLGNEVLSFITKGSRITGVVTANGNITADIVVLATGTNTNDLCRPLDLKLPVNVSPAILIKFHTKKRFVNRIISNSFMEVRAASNTLTLAAEDYINESVEDNPQAIAQRTLQKIKEYWRGAEQIKLADVMVGRRPMPQDILPIIGRTKHIEGLYLLVMHTGVTLAAITGRLAAAEISSGQDDILLSPYRLERFGLL